jgi:hypothetical protein
MRLDQLQTMIVLEHLTCRREGSDIPPALWTVFLKIDGDSVTLDGGDFTLNGAAIVRSAPGSFGDLGAGEVHAGDAIPIPESIGHFTTVLQPIPVSDAIQALGAPARVSGVAGVLCTLVARARGSNGTAETDDGGYGALTAAVREELSLIIDRLGVLNQQPSPDDVDAVAGRIRDAIVHALRCDGPIVQRVPGLIDSRSFVYTHTQLTPAYERPLSGRFESEDAGEWEISGQVAAWRVPARTAPPRLAGRACGPDTPHDIRR